MTLVIRLLLPAIGLMLLTITPPARAEPVDFTLNDFNGRPVKLSDYRGNWVFVNFWAAWCSPCVRELSALADFQKANPQVTVLGINFEATTAQASRRFLHGMDVGFTNLKIGTEPLVPFEPLDGLPTTVIVDPAGELVERHTGPLTSESLQHIFDRLHRR